MGVLYWYFDGHFIDSPPSNVLALRQRLIQNREFFFALDVKGSILFDVFNNDISNYIEGTL